jgi:ELWxxDGT repeat protein
MWLPYDGTYYVENRCEDGPGARRSSNPRSFVAGPGRTSVPAGVYFIADLGCGDRPNYRLLRAEDFRNDSPFAGTGVDNLRSRLSSIFFTATRNSTNTIYIGSPTTTASGVEFKLLTDHALYPYHLEDVTNIHVSSDRVYFVATEAGTRWLYRYEPPSPTLLTGEIKRLATPLPAGAFVPHILEAASLYAVIETSSGGGELYRVEPGALVHLPTASAAQSSGVVGPLVLLDQQIHFGGKNSFGDYDIYSTDGFTTSRRTNLVSGSVVAGLAASGEDLLFHIAPPAMYSVGALWKMGELPGQETEIKSSPTESFTTVSSMTSLDDVVYFAGTDNDSGSEPWLYTNGEAAFLGDINPGPDGSDPREFTAAGYRVMFVAYTPEMGREVFVHKRLFGPGNWPDGNWHPFENSQFRVPLAANAPVHPYSPQMVDSIILDWERVGGGIPHNFVAQADGHIGEPTYFIHEGVGQKYTIHCRKCKDKNVDNSGYSSDPCPLEGTEIWLPNEAVPEQRGWRKENGNIVELPEWASDCGWQGGSADIPDFHMTLIDEIKGLEYDLYQVFKPANGVLNINYGTATPLSGDALHDTTGRPGGGTAAGFAGTAGRIRAESMFHGEINHALFMVVPFTRAGGWTRGMASDGRVFDANDRKFE